MTQAIEFTELPRCQAPRPTWFGHLRALFVPVDCGHALPLGARSAHLSAHLLRDIGLAEGLRSNPLLRERNFLRS